MLLHMMNMAEVNVKLRNILSNKKLLECETGKIILNTQLTELEPRSVTFSENK